MPLAKTHAAGDQPTIKHLPIDAGRRHLAGTCPLPAAGARWANWRPGAQRIRRWRRSNHALRTGITALQFKRALQPLTEILARPLLPRQSDRE